MRKKDFDKEFIAQVVSNLDRYTTTGFLDKPMVRMEYNDTTDALQKNGEITEWQRCNWIIPNRALNLKYLKIKRL